MTYGLLNLPFLAVAAVMLAVALLRRPAPRGPVVRTLLITAGVLLVMTAAFDNLMIAVGLVGYDPRRISGLVVGIAPVEDFAYAVAVVLLLPALWMLLPPRHPASRTGADPATVTAAPTVPAPGQAERPGSPAGPEPDPADAGGADGATP